MFTDEYLTENYVGWLNDPEVVKYSEQRHKKHTMSSCSQYYKSFISSSHLFIAILVKDNSFKHIGNITVSIDSENLVADIAIMIGEKSSWGQGFGKEAFIGVMDYLFHKTKIRKITAGTMAINIPMLGIMKSAGMIIEGRKKEQFLVDGEKVDMVMAAAWAKSE